MRCWLVQPHANLYRTMAASRAGALAKLWAYHKPTSGMVTRTLSPFEQEVVKPMFHNVVPKVRPLSMPAHRSSSRPAERTRSYCAAAYLVQLPLVSIPAFRCFRFR